MVWRKDNYKNIPDLPDISKVSEEIPAVSKYLEAFRLPDAFKQAEIDTLPVIDITGRIVGIVSEYDLAKILPEWSFEEQSYRHNVLVSEIMTKDVWTEEENTSIKDLLSSIHEMHIRVIPIVDENGRYTGSSITRTAMISFLTRMVKPRSIGGLATPLGVYMTDGIHQAGSKNPGLLLTGVALGFISFIVMLITSFIFNYMNPPLTIVLLLQLTIFILILRFTPFSKIHAAEHQTIHAIEKGLPLNLETVRMQPREHKRCGTNIMVLLVGIQLIILLSAELRVLNPFLYFLFLVFSLLVVFSNYRKLGMWIQKHLTTSKANDFQIKNGIKVGEELLKMHKDDTTTGSPGFIQKVWNMGIIQILLTFFLTLTLLNKLLTVMW